MLSTNPEVLTSQSSSQAHLKRIQEVLRNLSVKGLEAATKPAFLTSVRGAARNDATAKVVIIERGFPTNYLATTRTQQCPHMNYSQQSVLGSDPR